MGGLQEHIYVFGDFSCYTDIGEFCKKNYYHQNLQLASLAGESHRSAWHVRVQIILVCRLIRDTDNIYTFINETKKYLLQGHGWTGRGCVVAAVMGPWSHLSRRKKQFTMASGVS